MGRRLSMVFVESVLGLTCALLTQPVISFFSSCGVDDAHSRPSSNRVQPGDRKLLTGARNIFSLVEQTAAAVGKGFITVLDPRNIS